MKKLFPFILAIVVFLFSSCREVPPLQGHPDETASEIELRPVETIEVPNAWQEMFVTLPHEYSASSDRTTAVDGQYYIHVTDTNSEDSFKYYYIVSSEGDFLGLRKIPLYAEDTNAGEPAYFGSAVHTDGIAVLESVVKQHPTSGVILSFEQSFLSAYDAEDRLIYRVDPEKLIEIRENPMNGSDADFTLRPEKMLYGANGTLYLIMEYSVVAVGPTGEKMYETGPEYYINDAIHSADGRILVQYTHAAERSTHWAYMDDDAKGFSAPLRIPASGVEEYTLVSGYGHEFYFNCADGLCFMDAEDAAPTLLLDWNENGIRYDEILFLHAADENSVFVFTGKREWVDTVYKYALLKRTSAETDSTRKVITLGLANANLKLESYVKEFNRRSGEYYVVIRDMIQPWLDHQITTEQQILENPPDLVIGGMESTANLASKGMFVNLYTYLDADPEFRDDLVSCILKPCEINGRLYHLASGVQISGSCGRADNLPEVADWDVEILLELIEAAEKNGQVAVGDTYRAQMKKMLIGDTLSTFVDFDNAVCDFENELFLSILNYLKDIPEKRGTGYSTGEINLLYRQNTFLLDSNSTIKRMEDHLKLRAQFGDSELSYLGVPSPEGGIPIINTGNSCLSITADSPVKEGAWEFIRYIVYEEQIHFFTTSNNRLPVTKSNIRWQAEREGEYFLSSRGVLCCRKRFRGTV